MARWLASSLLCLLCCCALQLVHSSRSRTVLGPSSNTTTPTSTHQCYGSTAAHRSCLFGNLFYSVDSNTFHVVYDEDIGQTLDDIDFGSAYNISGLSTAATNGPTVATTMRQYDLNMFWTFTNGGAGYSFGHALLHELFPMYVALSNLLGEDVPTAFNLVSMDGNLPGVFNHLCVATQDRVFNWPQLLDEAKASGKRWIWFESAILGDGGATPFANNLNYAVHPDPNIFNNVRWLGFRKWVLHSVGVDPAHHPKSTSIVINDKDTEDSANPGHKDRRRIINTKELVLYLKKAFPMAQVAAVKFTTLSWRRQLDLLASTTIFISTEGSSSFRYVFLPAGASAIVLAHPDNTTAGAEPLGTIEQFHEIDKYFPISYVNFIKYWVDVKDKDEYEEYEKEGEETEYKYKLYHAHIIVKMEKIERMIRSAIRLYGMWQRDGTHI